MLEETGATANYIDESIQSLEARLDTLHHGITPIFLKSGLASTKGSLGFCDKYGRKEACSTSRGGGARHGSNNNNSNSNTNGD